MSLGMEIGLGPGDFVRWEPRSPSQKGGAKFSTHVCGQTAGWIKMTLGMDVGLRPGDFVLDGDSAPSQKTGEPLSPIFSPCLLWPNGRMDQDATLYGGRPRGLRDIVLYGD